MLFLAQRLRRISTLAARSAGRQQAIHADASNIAVTALNALTSITPTSANRLCLTRPTK
jgi:hypothetical protein